MGLFCTNISGGSQPKMPSYGEGMREALEAQVALLTGTEVGDADFSEFEGGLQKLIQDYEAPLRQTTAQIDTDILRQTLLGSQQKVVKDPETGKFGIPGAEVVTGEDGEPQTAGGGRYQIIQISAGKRGDPGSVKLSLQTGKQPKYAILDTQTGGYTKEIGGEEYNARELAEDYGFSKDILFDDTESAERSAGLLNAIRDELLKDVSGEFNKLSGLIEEEGVDAPAREFNFTNPNTGEPLQEGDVVRAEDGMVDLLGDKQDIVGTRSATAEDVELGLATEVGEEIETRRKAGFDEGGNFLGLSALAEDIQRGNLSRQREADLADVERLSDRYQDVMSDFKPVRQRELKVRNPSLSRKDRD